MDTKKLTQAAAELGASSIIVKDDNKVTVIAKEATRQEYSVTDIIDDFFHEEYENTDPHQSPESSRRSTVQILKPPIAPNVLEEKVLHNNTLQPLVHAMEVNCETTGYTLQLREGFEETEETNRQKAYATALFENPYPSCSFTHVRRDLRRAKETTGYAAMEVIRNQAGEICFLRSLPSNEVRVLKMDRNDPVENVEVEREGMPACTLPMRRRRYVRLVEGRRTRQYFKEFGTEDELDARTGQWLNIPESVLRQKAALNTLFTSSPPEGAFNNPGDSRFLNPAGDPNQLNPAALNPSAQAEGQEQNAFHRLANEVIWFTLHKDPQGPYGYPRWISQLPSVLGSRAAEESNFHLLQGGGIPPVLVTITGGTLTDASRKQLENYLNTPNNDQRMQAASVEILNTGGSIDGTETNARIEVHRFGGEELNDAMFQAYDEGCTTKVRGSFRLGGVFMGRVEDSNRANSVAQYVSAEAQVFRPERFEFDEVINATIMDEIAPAFKFVSNQQTFTDIVAKITALTQLKDEVIREDWVAAVSDTAGLALDRSTSLPRGESNDLEEGELLPERAVGAAATLQRSIPVAEGEQSPMLRVLFNSATYEDMQAVRGLSDEDFSGCCKDCAEQVYQDADMAGIVEQQVNNNLETDAS